MRDAVFSLHTRQALEASLSFFVSHGRKYEHEEPKRLVVRLYSAFFVQTLSACVREVLLRVAYTCALSAEVRRSAERGE